MKKSNILKALRTIKKMLSDAVQEAREARQNQPDYLYVVASPWV